MAGGIPHSSPKQPTAAATATAITEAGAPVTVPQEQVTKSKMEQLRRIMDEQKARRRARREARAAPYSTSWSLKSAKAAAAAASDDEEEEEEEAGAEGDKRQGAAAASSNASSGPTPPGGAGGTPPSAATTGNGSDIFNPDQLEPVTA